MAEGAPNLTPEEVLQHALEIAEPYYDSGVPPTLRQLYYRFVALGLLVKPEGADSRWWQRQYKRIGAVLTDARYEGTFPVEWLTDRSRTVTYGEFTQNNDDPKLALKQAADWIRDMQYTLLQRARWYGQPIHVSVWVEKEALAGVFESPCNELGVSWFACKGYPSVSALADWLEHTREACDPSSRRVGWEKHDGKAERCVVLYFGDHDPDGWEIPRSAERNLGKLQRLGGDYIDIEFRRIALNMDQVRRFSPPPFEAKVTSARYASYISEHGTDEAWELDALEPHVLQRLIRGSVADLFDEDIHDANEQVIRMRRAEMRETMSDEDWMLAVWEDE